jgi:hypothetical protein
MRGLISTGRLALLVALLVSGCGNLVGDIGERSMSQPDPAKRDGEKARRE